MRSLNRWIGLIFLIASMTVSASEYHFKFNYQDRSQDLPEYHPEVIDAGFIVINGVKMQAYNTRFFNPRENGGKSYFQAKPFTAKIKAEHLKHFDLYAMPNGMVIVPQGWRLAQGAIGNDGAISYTFIPPTNSDGYLMFYHNGECLDCAIESASLFFPEAYRDAKSRNLNPYTSSNFPLNVTKIKPHLFAYYTEFGNNRIDGISFYNLKNKKIPFWKVEVSLPKMQLLSNPILNRFISIYN